jgi:beta-N-acetylhexosaminidase
MLIATMVFTSEGGARGNDATKHSVGQMIIAGFFGTRISDPGFERVIDDLEDNVIGGVLFLARNIASRSDLQTMVDRIKRCKCSARPIIAIDEEGGSIERLGGKFGNEHTHSAEKIGRSGEASARREYRKLALRLSEAGFNMNLAPVVDVNRNPTNPIIARLGRSFSEDPLVVARYAAIFIREHRRHHVITSLKHFPGHGSSTQDSHASVADVASTWSRDELIPFHVLISQKLADSVMVGHLANQNVWGGAATQAHSVAVSQLLRRELKFDGVVISDDLGMDAVRLGSGNFADVIISAVKGGADLLIVGRLPDEAADPGRFAYSALINAMDTGAISAQSVESSLSRIARLKNRRLGR